MHGRQGDERGSATWSNVGFFPEVEPSTDTLSFFSFADVPLSIFSSSQPIEEWDILWGTGDDANPDFRFEDSVSVDPLGILSSTTPARTRIESSNSSPERSAGAMELSGDDVASPPLPGDFNGNGVLDADDIDRLAGGAQNPSLDVTGDGAVEQDDRIRWVHELAIDLVRRCCLLDVLFSSADFVEVIQTVIVRDDRVSRLGRRRL